MIQLCFYNKKTESKMETAITQNKIQKHKKNKNTPNTKQYKKYKDTNNTPKQQEYKNTQKYTKAQKAKEYNTIQDKLQNIKKNYSTIQQ